MSSSSESPKMAAAYARQAKVLADKIDADILREMLAEARTIKRMAKAPKEGPIRKALKKRVEAYGGEVRAMAWLGRGHAPDVAVLFFHNNTHWLVETKGTEGEPREGQLREHERLRRAGFKVAVVRNLRELDEWLPPL